MEVNLFIGNLSKSTTDEDLTSLFTKAGEVVSVSVGMDSQSGRGRGYAFITMSAQSEADRAVSMFNHYSLDEHPLKVSLVRSRIQRGI